MVFLYYMKKLLLFHIDSIKMKPKLNIIKHKKIILVGTKRYIDDFNYMFHGFNIKAKIEEDNKIIFKNNKELN